MQPRDLMTLLDDGKEKVFSVRRDVLEEVADEFADLGYRVVKVQACSEPHISEQLWCINCGDVHDVDEHRFIRMDIPPAVQCRKCHEYYDTRP